MELSKSIRIVRELMENDDIPMKKYHVDVCKMNGEYQICIHLKSNAPLFSEMKHFSQIFNKHSESWIVHMKNNVLCFTVE